MDSTLFPQGRPIGIRIGDAKECESSDGDGKLEGAKDEHELGIPPFQLHPPWNLHTGCESGRLSMLAARSVLSQ